MVADPRAHGDKIVRFFGENGVTRFARDFASVYGAGAAPGTRSWIGLDDRDNVVMHIGRFSERFAMAGDEVTGGLLCDLMVAPSHRTLFPALSLVRRVVAEERSARDVDFLYTNPNAAAAGVVRLAGFGDAGRVQRLVYPLGDSRPVHDAAAWAWLMLQRTRVGRKGASVEPRPADSAIELTPSTARDADRLVPLRGPAFLRWRLRDYPGPRHRWLAWKDAGESDPVGAALVTGPNAAGEVELCALWHRPSHRLCALMPRLAWHLRSEGVARLVAATVADSKLSDELVRAGFVRRERDVRLYTLALTPRGSLAAGMVGAWDLSTSDFDGAPL